LLNGWAFIEIQRSLVYHHLKLSNAVGYGGHLWVMIDDWEKWLDQQLPPSLLGVIARYQ
jgi:hypothetical protein